MRGWASRLRGLTRGEIRLLLEAQRELVACQLAKWRRPVGALLDWSGPGPEPGTRSIRARDVEQVAWAVSRASAYGLFRPRCLVRSLAIQRMLRRRGITSSSLGIGVRVQQGSFEAHAWVELDGAIVGDTPAHVQSFTRITDHRLVEL